jgi:hypothetical protein
MELSRLVRRLFYHFGKAAEITIRDHKPHTSWGEEIGCAFMHAVVHTFEELQHEF